MLSLLFALFLPFEKFLRRPRWSSWSVRRPLLFDLDFEEKLVGQSTGGFKQRSPPSGELVGAWLGARDEDGEIDGRAESDGESEGDEVGYVVGLPEGDVDGMSVGDADKVGYPEG